MNGCKVDLHKNSELTLLDLYSGCGAMSTGLCLGANMAGSNLVTVSLLFNSSNLSLMNTIVQFLLVLLLNFL